VLLALSIDPNSLSGLEAGLSVVSNYNTIVTSEIAFATWHLLYTRVHCDKLPQPLVVILQKKIQQSER